MTTKPKTLDARMLCAVLDPDRIPYADSREIPSGNGYSRFQPRAIQALELALRIKGNEYNIYVAGDSNMGRTYFVRNHLKPAARKASTPPDWIYLHNFENADRPVAVRLPAGQGRAFKNAMSKALAAIRADLPAYFDRDSYHKRHETLFKSHNQRREDLFAKMEEAAKAKQFRLEMDEAGGLTLSPMVDGEAIDDKAFEQLPKKERTRLKREGDVLLSDIGTFLRQINQSEKGLKREELELQRTIAREALAENFQPLVERFGSHEKLASHIKDAEEYLVENVDLFLPKDGQANLTASQNESNVDDHFSRFDVNLFVDNSRTEGAPIIVEDHPTNFNLLGSIEREAELGALYTDHTLIRPGSLHKANHGFLILNTEDLLSSPSSWEGLLRALRAGRSRIEDPVDQEQVRTRTIEPETIPLDLKIVLIGTDENYEALLYHDDRFQKYFKLKAHMQSTAPRTMPNIRHYLTVIGRIVRESGLLPFDRAALAGLVDFSSRLVEDQKKLSLHFPLVRERMIEASALAEMDGKDMVGADHLREAVGTRDFRSNLFEEEYMGDYEREVIKVATTGEAVGRCNGLSVTLFGDYEFGLPHQISCTVGVGHGGILDLEREAQLGGPIHTKGMMILKSYLLNPLRPGQAHGHDRQPLLRAELRRHRGRFRLGRGAGRAAFRPFRRAHQPLLRLHGRGEPVRPDHGRGRREQKDRRLLRGLPPPRAHGPPGRDLPQGQRREPDAARRRGPRRGRGQVLHPPGQQRGGGHGHPHRASRREKGQGRTVPPRARSIAAWTTAWPSWPAWPANTAGALPPDPAPPARRRPASLAESIDVGMNMSYCWRSEGVMSKAWIMAKRPEFVRDMFRNFCQACGLLDEQFERYDRVGSVDFEQLRDLIGEESFKGLLWRLKDTAHHVFRNDPDDPIEGRFLDWGMGYIFHECIKLKEDSYQQLTYAPWAARDGRGRGERTGRGRAAFEPAGPDRGVHAPGDRTHQSHSRSMQAAASRVSFAPQRQCAARKTYFRTKRHGPGRLRRTV